MCEKEKHGKQIPKTGASSDDDQRPPQHQDQQSGASFPVLALTRP